MASPRRLVAATLVAALALTTLAAARPAFVPGNTPTATPGNTPTSGGSEVVAERTVSLSTSTSSDMDEGHDDRTISCGGTAPFTQKCTRSMILDDGGRRWGIEVEPGYRGTVVWQLATVDDVLVRRCTWDGTESLTEKQRDCFLEAKVGNFSAGERVWLTGKTLQPGTDPVDDQSYGLWEVSFTDT